MKYNFSQSKEEIIQAILEKQNPKNTTPNKTSQKFIFQYPPISDHSKKLIDDIRNVNRSDKRNDFVLKCLEVMKDFNPKVLDISYGKHRHKQKTKH